MKSFILIATFVAVIQGKPDTSSLISNRIINGEFTTIEDRPFQVSIQKSEKIPPYRCSGSIISKNYVVTVAHCVRFDRELLSIRAGSTYYNKEGSIHQIESFIVHEDFVMTEENITMNNDIALLKVKEPFEFDETTQPIKLFNHGETTITGVGAVVSGWGLTESLTLPTKLKKVTVPVVSEVDCKKAYADKGGITKGQLCAGYYGLGIKDACGGDSGGPITVNDRLIGIVSWAIGCASPDFPGVYTEIAYYRDWIKKNADV